MAGRYPFFESPELLQQAIDLYFKTCEAEKKQPTITRLAYDLGFESRQSFYDYEEKPQFSYIIKRARLFVESGYEANLQNAACTGAIFALKNMGWKDKQEIDTRYPEGVNINFVKKGADYNPDEKNG